MDSSGYVNVYTDGACPGAGQDGAKAGIGVFFGDKSSLNVSAPVKGPANNTLAEIQAVTKAAKVAHGAGITKLRIHTDSQAVIESGTKLASDGKIGMSVPNRDELQKMASALAPLKVEWNHVPGHKGNHGNEMADKLARKGAEDYTPR